MILITLIKAYGKPLILHCDGQCDIVEFNGTYEGGYGKPTTKQHNKWCFRSCPRSRTIEEFAETTQIIFKKTESGDLYIKIDSKPVGKEEVGINLGSRLSEEYSIDFSDNWRIEKRLEKLLKRLQKRMIRSILCKRIDRLIKILGWEDLHKKQEDKTNNGK